VRKVLAIVLAMLALAAVVPPAGANPTSEEAEKAIRNRLGAQAVQAPQDSYRINDGFYSQTYNHLGNPARGIVVADTWGETGWVSTETGDVADNTQGFARALLLRRTLRVAVRVELWGATETTADLITSSSTVNSSGAPTVQVATPEVPNLQADPHCIFWTVVFLAIRWDDNRLSNVSFEMPFWYFNPNCLIAA
jgi:hypothetical protein